MAIAAVALIAMIFIGISFFRPNKDCPSDIEIHTEEKYYEIGEEVHFSLKTAGSLPRISTYKWATEDGQTSDQASPIFTFNKTGTQQILVKINEDCEYPHIIEIDDDDVDIQVKPGTISASKTTTFVDETIKFKDSSEGASAYWWSFGDANSSDSQNPTHTYKYPGKYTASRTLNGDGDVQSLQITIKERDKPKSLERTANFSIENPNARAGELVQFTDKTPNAKSWLWNFGDGYTSPKRDPTHVYNFDGEYIVMLSVNETGKNVNTQTIKIAPRIVAPPPPGSMGNPPPPSPPPPVKMDLATTLKTKFQEIAKSDDDEFKTNVYYTVLLDLVADENMPVEIVRNGKPSDNTFYRYYNNLKIQGGQSITRVEVLNTDTEKRATALRITEQ